jgi:hypothetical protein
MTRFLGSSNAQYPSIPMVLPDEETGGLWRAVDGWIYHQRHRSQMSGGSYKELWPRSGFSQDLSMFGNSYNDRADFAPQEFGFSGKQGHYSIRGQVLDNASIPVSGATVLAFLTSTNAVVGSATSDVNGNYVIATPFTVAQHYVVAFNGSIAQGATVNTLTATVN